MEPTTQQIALINANLIVGEESVQPESTVVVEGDPNMDAAIYTKPERHVDPVLLGGRIVKHRLEDGCTGNFRQWPVRGLRPPNRGSQRVGLSG